MMCDVSPILSIVRGEGLRWHIRIYDRGGGDEGGCVVLRCTRIVLWLCGSVYKYQRR